MTFAVDRINGVRAALDDRAGKLPAGDPLAARLRAASDQVDALRKKIVATTEGGAITGEERLREYLASLYDSVVCYEGRPSQTQAERASALSSASSPTSSRTSTPGPRRSFPASTRRSPAKSLPPIALLTRADWEKQGEEGGAGGGAAAPASRESDPGEGLKRRRQ